LISGTVSKEVKALSIWEKLQAISPEILLFLRIIQKLKKVDI